MVPPVGRVLGSEDSKLNRTQASSSGFSCGTRENTAVDWHALCEVESAPHQREAIKLRHPKRNSYTEHEGGFDSGVRLTRI